VPFIFGNNLVATGFYNISTGAAYVPMPTEGTTGKVNAERENKLEPKKPEPKESEPKELTAIVSSSRKVTDSRGAPLYVIDGNVTNNYAGPRSFIKLKATITSADGAMLGSREVFAGNALPDEEIRNLERAKIDGKLNTAPGAGLRNFNVPASTSIPFQVIFYDVAQSVQTQTVEAVSSEPGTE
jgi:hypothetical protein